MTGNKIRPGQLSFLGQDLAVGGLSLTGSNNQALRFRMETEVLSGLVGSSVETTTIKFPIGSVGLGVAIHIISDITGPSNINIGAGLSPQTRYGNNVAVAAGTTHLGVSVDVYQSGLAEPAILYASGPNFTGGEVRVTIYYIDLDPPTS